MASNGLLPEAEDEPLGLDAEGRTVAVPDGVTAVGVRRAPGVPTAEGVPTLKPPDVLDGVRQVISACKFD